MPNHTRKHKLFPAWLAPAAVAALLSACGGGDREPAAGGGTAGGAPATPPPPAESPAAGTAQAPTGDTQAAGAETSSQAPAKPAAPAAAPAAGGGGAGAGDPKLIALGDSVFHGQAGGGTCYACHGQDAKGSGVGPDLTDGEWLNTDGTLEGITKVVQNGVPTPKKAPAPMPPMGGASLTPEHVRAVSAYVHSLN